MRRWHPTAALGLLAGGAALLAPSWLQSPQVPFAEPLPIAAPHVPELVELLPEGVESGALHLTAGLDHPAILAGQTQERLLVITVRADELEGGERAPVNVAVVMDRSGSMRQQGRMDYAQTAARDLVSSLEQDDRIALVSFSSAAQLVVPSTHIRDPMRLHRAIDGVQPAGSTNVHAGLLLGQEQVRQWATPESVDRVILLSDGYANVGVQLPSELSMAAGRWAEQGIAVSTIGLGLDYNEDLLAAMADAGGGSYRFVNDPQSLKDAFDDELDRLNSVAARGVGLDINLKDAELIDVLGYEAERTDTGMRIWLGDVYNGETRRVVVRVRMHGENSKDALSAATVRLSEGGTQVVEPVLVSAMVTDNPTQVERLANRELAILGNEAYAADSAQAAADAYAKGDQRRGAELAFAGELIAGQAASRYSSERLSTQSGALKEQAGSYESYAPTSDEGRYNTKANKESNRDWLR